MNGSPSTGLRALEDKAFLLLLVVVSLLFAWILWPYFGAMLWATVLAIVFAPLQRQFLRFMRRKRTVAALATVTVILLLVILPIVLISLMLVQEGLLIYDRIQSGEVSIPNFFQQVFSAMPGWVNGILDRLGLSNLDMIRDRLSGSLTKGSQFLATQALSFGQNTLDFVVNLFILLYLLFFLLRDADSLSEHIGSVVPLRVEHRRALVLKFNAVIRATFKGNLVIALVQGTLGGVIFWLLGIHAPALWGILMAITSLVPSVGSALVWLPLAIYLIATGATGKGVILIVFGTLVIGLVDNLLRPMLVGKDTRMPDYVVLISTLGGIAIFGINGFVIGPVIAAMFIAVWDMAGRMWKAGAQ